MTLAVATAAAVAGALIGLTGIGGVLLVPALTELAGVSIERAVAASMTSFLVAGAVAAYLHLRHAVFERRILVSLCGASAAGALAGAATLAFLPPVAVRLFIAVLALASGLNALLRPHKGAGERLPSPATLGALGVAVGYGSAISGTGGPVLLIPVLLALNVPAGAAVALGLAAQIPISLTATAVNFLAGRIDWQLGSMLAVLVLAGTLAGSALAPRLSRRGVTVAVALTLIGVGLWYGATSLNIFASP
jgi:uncharacterized membrane protein YfcA